MLKLRTRAPLALLLLALPASTVAGQAPQGGFVGDSKTDPGPAIQEVRLRVDDYRTKKDLGYMLEGDVLEIAPGDDVIVRVVAVPAGGERAVRYPTARFELLSGARRINLFKANEEHGSVVIHGVRPDDPVNAGSTTLVEFTITSPLNAHQRLLKGTFSVVVKAPAGPPPVADARAIELTAVLYRAILLREPDAAGTVGKIATIRDRGYEGILAVAAEMAASPESREDVYRLTVTVEVGGKPVTRPVNDEDRLLAMYREIVAISDVSIVRAEEWNHHLERMARGKIADVVRELLGRREFFDRYGIEWESTRTARPR
jgi:hypothetical protein